MDPKDLTLEEWFTVLEGISGATSMIVMADASGPIGISKEAMAPMEVLRSEKWQTPFIVALRNTVLASTKEQQDAFQKLAQARQAAMKGQKQSKEQVWYAAIDAIRNAVKLVEEKAGPEAATEYKQLILEGSQKTAEAGKEGGFLGIGGKMVSDNELQALEQIKKALALEASA
jgi:hypothetical protein